MAGVQVTFVGEMYYTGLGVGGGPMPGGPTPMPPIYYPPAQPPVIWPSPGHPAHPIAPGGSPPGIWGGAPLPVPTPPIYYPPVQPPVIWPSPGHPAHPIVLPPGQPPTIWPSPGVPSHPIVLPPVDIPPPEGEEAKWQVQTYWTPQSGWGVAIVPGPGNVGVPTPSEKK
jgi:hypothetical protein